jgi:hypothetical protein
MDGKTYEDQVIKITDLVGDDGILDGFSFMGCQIKGPAIVWPGSSALRECNLGGPGPDAVLWEAPRSGTVLVGVIIAENCTFERCTFLNIGFVLPPDRVRQLRQQLWFGS